MDERIVYLEIKFLTSMRFAISRVGRTLETLASNYSRRLICSLFMRVRVPLRDPLCSHPGPLLKQAGCRGTLFHDFFLLAVEKWTQSHSKLRQRESQSKNIFSSRAFSCKLNELHAIKSRSNDELSWNKCWKIRDVEWDESRGSFK